ncbi:hypothetical protein HZA38_04140 [Candidatus Peregrinibacteria bacterium]|nr:hypothetical protein [Candidatus Peregrinibacteria bacterium]
MDERIFYVDQDTDISEFISKIVSAKADTIVFVLPRKSLLFESIVNLQILRSEAEKNGKSLVVITILAKARKMCETAGIESHPTLEHWEKKLPEDTISAKKNPVNVNFERSFVRKRSIGITEEGSLHHPPVSERANWKDVFSKPSWEALLGLFIFSVGLLAFLSFLAFPGATIDIKPEKKGVETIVNVMLFNLENEKNRDVLYQKEGIAGFPIESVFEKSIKFPTITKDFRGSHSSGEITVYNFSPEEKRLRPQTRFQTPEGLVFRISDWLEIPAEKKDASQNIVPGMRTVSVTADAEDVSGKIVGEEGNIGPSKFFLPGLSEAFREKIWAESTSPFSGGRTDWSPKITSSDIGAAKNKITTDLLGSAEENLQKFISEKNSQETLDLSLLLGKSFLETKIMDIVVENDILGKNQESFSVSAKIRVRTWAYSENALYSLLWDSLSAKTDPKMRLVGIDEESISPELLERDEKNGSLKLAISVRGAEEYVIDPRSEQGILFVNSIKSEIEGMEKNAAEALISNKEEVSEVSISLWPFWSSTIPKLPENISIRLSSGTSSK